MRREMRWPRSCFRALADYGLKLTARPAVGTIAPIAGGRAAA